MNSKLVAVLLYVLILFVVGILSYRKHRTASDFLIGGRSMNYWLTAMAAHASDMSGWLFIGFPAVIFSGGLFNAWYAVGLCLFMLLNWLIVAPRIRAQTEAYNSITFSSFFESHFHDTSGLIRVFTAVISLIFYSIYISAGIVGLGMLVQSLFGIPYPLAIILGLLVVLPYLFLGGYTALAWIDLFQGLFLLVVVVAVPLLILPTIGGWEGITTAAAHRHVPLSMLPQGRPHLVWEILFAICGWGMGYFGQPHIVTKFMGIKKVTQMKKSMAVGMTWQALALSGATCIGLVGIAYFSGGLTEPELLFTTMVKECFPPIIMTFILCAALGATLSTMDSQILVLASSLTEDFYKRVFRKNATSKELVWVSRLFILLVTGVAYAIASTGSNTIYSLVFYAWSGLGAAFGPLLIFCLYSKRANKYGAWGGIVVGGMVALLWPFVNAHLPIDVPALIPGFLLSSLAILTLSSVTQRTPCAPSSSFQ